RMFNPEIGKLLAQFRETLWRHPDFVDRDAPLLQSGFDDGIYQSVNRPGEFMRRIELCLTLIERDKIRAIRPLECEEPEATDIRDPGRLIGDQVKRARSGDDARSIRAAPLPEDIGLRPAADPMGHGPEAAQI